MLRLALQGLAEQTIAQKYFEVLVVDNNSQDKTREVSESFARVLPLRYINEERQGLSHARNRGVLESQGEYVAFLDDDAIPDEAWLETAKNLLSHPEDKFDCIGGPIFPFYTTEKPDWFKDKYETRSWGDKPRFLDRWQAFAGSNMIWRKEMINKLGGFDVSLGMSGENLALGEDSKLFFALWKQYPGARVFYSPQLVVKHWTPIEKMNIEYQKRRSIAKGVSSYYIHKTTWSPLKRTVWFVKLIGGVIVFSILALVNKRNYIDKRNWLIEEWYRVIIWYMELLTILGFNRA